MSTEQNKALVLRLYEQFDKGTLDELGESIGSDFVARVLGTTTLDWAGFMQFGSAFRSGFPDGRHVFDHVVAEGEAVVTIGTYQGTHTREFQGIPPTDRRLRLSVMHLDRVVGGKIVEHLGLANEVDFMRQLGIVLEPKRGDT